MLRKIYSAVLLSLFTFLPLSSFLFCALLLPSSCFLSAAPRRASNQRRPQVRLRSASAHASPFLTFFPPHAFFFCPDLSLLSPLHLWPPLFCPSGRSHVFKPQIVTSIARPSSPSPFTADAPSSHPSSSDSGNTVPCVPSTDSVLE